MIDKDTLKICKDLILGKFKVEDLKFCLQNLGCNTYGRKDDLQRRLKTALDSTRLQKEAAKVVLLRGSILTNFPSFPRECFIEKPVQKVSVSSSLRSPSSEIYPVDRLMKKLYFHENIVNISPWQRSTNSDINNTVFINCIIPSNISISSLASTKTQVAQNCVLLRSSKLLLSNDNTPHEDTYPVLMRMFVNGCDHTNLLPREICYSSIDRKNRLSIPTVLNEALLANPENIKNNKPYKIELRFDSAANRDDRFIFGIFTSTQKTVKEICAEIISREKLDFIRFSQDLKKFMSTSGDIQLEFAKISLLSSTTRRRIRIPFRGKYCNHLNPDDLEDYIEINRSSEAWKCKICKAICTPDDISVDEFYMEILSKHKRAEEIELYPDMSYKLFGGDESKSLGKPIPPKKRRTDEEIIIIDSDEDEDEEEEDNDEGNIQEPIPTKNESVTNTNIEQHTNINVQPSTIPQKHIECITIDDSSDEEEPPQKKNRCNGGESSNTHILQPTLFSNTFKVSGPQFPSDGFSSDDSDKSDTCENDLFVVLDDEDSVVTTNEIAVTKICPVFEQFIKNINDKSPCNSTNLYFEYQDDEDLVCNANIPGASKVLTQGSTISKNFNETDKLNLYKNGNSPMVKDYFKTKNDETLSVLDEFINNVEKTMGFIPPPSY
uniref:SP-RING-type domain-containing protein n=1 Tax=Strongyloides venezuelensis TaxID=75913 RepID=A0A0K0G1L4_STRVS